MLRILFVLALLSSALAVSCIFTRDAPEVRLFVSSRDGSDGWCAGSPVPAGDRSDGPVRSLARARDLLRQAKRSGALKVSITIAGGRVFLNETLVLGEEDSGTGPGNVTILQGSTDVSNPTILSGGQSLMSSLWRPYPANPKLFVTTLLSSVAPFKQLWINGTRAIRARSPDLGNTYQWAAALQNITKLPTPDFGNYTLAKLGFVRSGADQFLVDKH